MTLCHVSDHRGRREHGGFFPLAPWLDCEHPWPFAADSVLFASGTHALRGLAVHQGWRRLLVPSYFCHEVTDDLRQHVPIDGYPDHPLGEEVELELGPDEAVLAVEYFGTPHHVAAIGGQVVVDRTHDPLASWHYARTPDFAMASLRKTLPLPDGGLLWSPRGLDLPPRPALSSRHHSTWLAAITAMAMRATYLAGGPVDKGAYLDLHRRAEQALGGGPVSAMAGASIALLLRLPVIELLEQRAHNLAAAADCWPSEHPRVERLDVPSHLVLRCEPGDLRDQLRRRLIARSIYPSVLWDLPDGHAPAERDFSERMLALAADHRYDPAAMRWLVRTVLDEVEAAR
jgi:hypothetical protein